MWSNSRTGNGLFYEYVPNILNISVNTSRFMEIAIQTMQRCSLYFFIPDFKVLILPLFWMYCRHLQLQAVLQVRQMPERVMRLPCQEDRMILYLLPARPQFSNHYTKACQCRLGCSSGQKLWGCQPVPFFEFFYL